MKKITIPPICSDKWIKEIKEALKAPTFKIRPPKKEVHDVRTIQVLNDYGHYEHKTLSGSQLENYQLYRCLIESRN